MDFTSNLKYRIVEVGKAVVFLDAEAAECLHWSGGVNLLKRAALFRWRIPNDICLKTTKVKDVPLNVPKSISNDQNLFF